MSCLKPEKILFHPELPHLLAEPGQFDPLLAREQALVPGTGLAPIDVGLTDPAGQAAGGKAEPLSNGIAGEPPCKQSSTASEVCCAVNRLLVLVGLVIDGQSERNGVTLIDLSTKLGKLWATGV